MKNFSNRVWITHDFPVAQITLALELIVDKGARNSFKFHPAYGVLLTFCELLCLFIFWKCEAILQTAIWLQHPRQTISVGGLEKQQDSGKTKNGSLVIVFGLNLNKSLNLSGFPIPSYKKSFLAQGLLKSMTPI
jgi:hypothetical protein